MACLNAHRADQMPDSITSREILLDDCQGDMENSWIARLVSGRSSDQHQRNCRVWLLHLEL